MKVYIKGVGMTNFEVEHRGSYERIYECANQALDSVSVQDIDTIFVSNNEPGSTEERQKHPGPMISSLLKKQIPILNVPAGCGGGGVALWNAINYIKKSDAKNVMIVGFENMLSNTSEKVTDEILMGGERRYEQTEGLVFPAQNALMAQQYMLKYGATSDDLALVALKNHENAFDNPKARFYKKRVTLEMIKRSPVVASPLRLFDCSISCNGAAAMVISKEESDIEIAGHGMSTSCLSAIEREDMTSLDATKKASENAYAEAGVKASDISIAEIHDAFTSLELMSYEDLGLCTKGEGIKMIREGMTKPDGAIPVNTSGGLKAKGHPISPTGISQIYELVKQMRGECGKRQIKKPEYGLTQNIGGAGTMVAVHILKNLAF
jgi:acetyl-CoA C-acetyltransferase